jgi:hypothetical protein
MNYKPIGVPYVDPVIKRKYRFGSWYKNTWDVWHLYDHSYYIMGLQRVNDLKNPRHCHILFRYHAVACGHYARTPEDAEWNSFKEARHSGLTICPKCYKIWKEQYKTEYEVFRAKYSERIKARHERERAAKNSISWRDM